MVVAEPYNVRHQARKPVNGSVELLGPLRQCFDILGAFPQGGIGDFRIDAYGFRVHAYGFSVHAYGFSVHAYGFSVLLHQPLKTIKTLFSSGSHHASFLGLATNFISSELG